MWNQGGPPLIGDQPTVVRSSAARRFYCLNLLFVELWRHRCDVKRKQYLLFANIATTYLLIKKIAKIKL